MVCATGRHPTAGATAAALWHRGPGDTWPGAMCHPSFQEWVAPQPPSAWVTPNLHRPPGLSPRVGPDPAPPVGTGWVAGEGRQAVSPRLSPWRVQVSPPHTPTQQLYRAENGVQDGAVFHPRIAAVWGQLTDFAHFDAEMAKDVGVGVGEASEPFPGSSRGGWWPLGTSRAWVQVKGGGGHSGVRAAQSGVPSGRESRGK